MNTTPMTDRSRAALDQVVEALTRVSARDPERFEQIAAAVRSHAGAAEAGNPIAPVLPPQYLRQAATATVVCADCRADGGRRRTLAYIIPVVVGAESVRAVFTRTHREEWLVQSVLDPAPFGMVHVQCRGVPEPVAISSEWLANARGLVSIPLHRVLACPQVTDGDR